VMTPPVKDALGRWRRQGRGPQAGVGGADRLDGRGGGEGTGAWVRGMSWRLYTGNGRNNQKGGLAAVRCDPSTRPRGMTMRGWTARATRSGPPPTPSLQAGFAWRAPWKN
jgi:hypothetical protein